ncbi:MAG: HNH endonuclease [Polyangiales bacterium]|nr:HNH endonuclease [Myxococcales bacterium]MCB9658459.1 HNH endonuclease [Sandaracinaceae bacterium]
MRTLVLDQGYQPHRIVSWQKGIALLFRGKVDVLEEYDDEVRTVSSVFRLPAVVRLRVPVPFRVQRIRFSRLNVLRRDGFACQYCGHEGTAKELTIDHVVPKARGGRTEWQNVVTACRPCNQRKGDRALARSGLVLAKPPAVPTWLPSGPARDQLGVTPPVWSAWGVAAAAE